VGVRRGQLGSLIIPALTHAQKQRDEAPSQYVRANSGWLAHYLEKFASEHLVKVG